jgi:uncharacterized protein (AIM24 family)
LIVSDSILDALLHLEQEQLERFCQSVQIRGEIAQAVEIHMKGGQSLWASKGCILDYNPSIQWSLKVPNGASGTMRRAMSGEGISMTFIEALDAKARVTLTANQPGKLATWDLNRGGIICTRGAFVCALGHVNIDVTMAKSVGAAFFGGAGLFLQKLSGDGIAFINGSGDFIERTLEPGEKILVSSGNLAAFSADVQYGIRGVGGCFKSLFGGEGLFMTELTGPGWVMLQSLKKSMPNQQGSR